MQQFRAGDEAAFSIVYHRFYRRVLFFSRRFVDEAEAQDITAEAFVMIWRKRADFAHLEKLVRFLFVTTRNRCFNKVKQDRTRKAVMGNIALLLEEHESERYWNDQEVQIELIELLQKQLDTLPVKTREVFLLSFQEGLKPAEIAERLGLSVQTVKNQKVTAIKLLRMAINPQQLAVILLILSQIENKLAYA